MLRRASYSILMRLLLITAFFGILGGTCHAAVAASLSVNVYEASPNLVVSSVLVRMLEWLLVASFDEFVSRIVLMSFLIGFLRMEHHFWAQLIAVLVVPRWLAVSVTVVVTSFVLLKMGKVMLF